MLCNIQQYKKKESFMMEEIKKKTIEGFSNYEIWSNGEVYNKKTKTFVCKSIDNRGNYKTREGFYGFYYVSIKDDNGVRKRKRIHRLLAENFIPKTKEDIELNRNCVDHIDRNSFNNDLNNLRWVNYHENSLNKDNILGTKDCHKQTSRKFNAYDKKTKELLYTFDNGKEVAEFLGIKDISPICQCCRGKGYRKTVHGYIWRYGDGVINKNKPKVLPNSRL